MERFEPYGKDFPLNFNYDAEYLDKQLNELFLNLIDKNLKYFKPNDYQQKIGLQYLDILEYEIHNDKILHDAKGYCGAWTFWYIYIRLKNKNIERQNLIYEYINYIRYNRLSFRNIIRTFTINITKIRDKILNKSNLTIDKYYYKNINDEDFNKLIKVIISFYKDA